jgi:hypothetical protein
MTEFEQRKKKLTEALNKSVKVTSDYKKAEEELNKHIGFKKQKDDFLTHVKVYMMTQGNF